MKYLIIILIIICSISLLTLYFIWPKRPLDAADVAVTVNGHALTKESVLSSETGPYRKSYKDSIDSAITRELLIQEAQHQNLDKEESFHLSLKTHYEESLIKTLLDRQHQQQVVVSEEEIDAYLALFGKKITFTRLPVSSSKAEGHTHQEASRNNMLFDDLADQLKFILSTLSPGEQATQFDTGSEQYAIRLDKVIPSEIETTTKPNRSQVKELLTTHRRQERIANWFNQLRSSASITINKD